MSGPTFTLPPQILDMLAKGIREIRPAPAYHVSHDPASDDVMAVEMTTDSGDVLTFLRGPDMERT